MFYKLLGTRQTLPEFIEQNGLNVQDLPAIEQCSNCSIWHKTKELINDLDGNLICRICERFYGL